MTPYLDEDGIFHTGISQERLDKREFEKVASHLIGQPASMWPKLTITWNYTAKDFFHSLDGVSASEMQRTHSHVFAVACIATTDLHNKLAKISKVGDYKDFWNQCDHSKACGVIGRWMSGASVTPPIIIPTNSKLFIVGGNHRFNVARLTGALTTSFITPLIHKEKVNRILPTVVWKTTDVL